MTLCKDVRNLLFGANKHDVDAWVVVNALEEPIQVDSVCSRYVSHIWAASLYGHLDDSIIVL